MNFTVFDVETANGTNGTICAIGIVKVQDGEITDTFYSLVNPESRFNSQNTEIHGITADDVKTSPTFAQLWSSLYDYFRGEFLFAYSAQFDIANLNAALERAGIDAPSLPYACALKVSRALVPGVGSYKQANVAKALGLDAYKEHNALEDATTTANILQKLASRIPVFDVASLLAFSHVSPELSRNRELMSDAPFQFQAPAPKPKKAYFNPYSTERKCDGPIKVKECFDYFGLNICITGDFQGYSRTEMEEIIKELGATCKAKVTKKVDYLVISRESYDSSQQTGKRTTKHRDAEELGIPIIVEEEFLAAVIADDGVTYSGYPVHL